MIEIILLIYLAYKNGELAKNNELSVRKWRIQTVLYWLVFEIPMILLSMSFTSNVLINTVSGSLAGVMGYFIVKTKLEKTIELSKDGVSKQNKE